MKTTIILYRSDVLSRNPHPDWLEWFNSLVKLQGRKHSLKIPGHLGSFWLSVNPESRNFVAWARDNGLLPFVNVLGADLSGANLSEAELSGSNLCDVNLSGADLSWAKLSGAYLSGADLSGADLSMADLSMADLSGTKFAGAKLAGAGLFGAARLSFDPPIPGWKLLRSGTLIRKY